MRRGVTGVTLFLRSVSVTCVTVATEVWYGRIESAYKHCVKMTERVECKLSNVEKRSAKASVNRYPWRGA